MSDKPYKLKITFLIISPKQCCCMVWRARLAFYLHHFMKSTEVLACMVVSLALHSRCTGFESPL